MQFIVVLFIFNFIIALEWYGNITLFRRMANATAAVYFCLTVLLYCYLTRVTPVEAGPLSDLGFYKPAVLAVAQQEVLRRIIIITLERKWSDSYSTFVFIVSFAVFPYLGRTFMIGCANANVHRSVRVLCWFLLYSKCWYEKHQWCLQSLLRPEKCTLYLKGFGCGYVTSNN